MPSKLIQKSDKSIAEPKPSATAASPGAWPGSFGAADATNPALQAWGPLGEYMTDAMQRTVLFWDVLRQRGDQYYEQKAKAVPHVLSFDAELVLDARADE